MPNLPDSDPKSNTREKPHTADVGNEKKADMSVVGDTSMSGAMKHLAKEHAMRGETKERGRKY